MGLTISSREDIKKYFDNESLNQSTLKLLDPGLDSFIDKQKEGFKKTESMIIGSAVDTILLGNEGDFSKEFFTSNIGKRPSENIEKIIRKIAETLEYNPGIDLKDEEYRNIIYREAIENGYGKSWKEETVVRKVVEEGEELYNELVSANGKEILSADQLSRINSTVESLKNNYRTRKYFDRQKLEEDTEVETFFQKIIYFPFYGVQCKAMLDMIKINIKDGQISSIQPFDLKTMMGYTIDFYTNFKLFRYDMQAAFYVEALKFMYPGVEIEPFKFIVESSTNQGKPLVYTVTENTLEGGKYGYIRNNYTKIGFAQLVSDYDFYQKNDWYEDIRTFGKEEIFIDFDKGLV